MHLLEGRFRRQFVPDGDGFLFRQWGRDVRFSREEVEAFIVYRRRVWSNPAVWTIYLLVGIGAPFLLATRGWVGSGWALGVVAFVVMAVMLVHADGKPREAAQARVVDPLPDGADGRALWFSPLLSLLYMIIAMTYLLDRKVSGWDRVWWIAVLAFLAGVLVVHFRRWRRGTGVA